MQLLAKKATPVRGANPQVPTTPPAGKKIENAQEVPKEGGARAVAPNDLEAQWHREMANLCGAFGDGVDEFVRFHELKGIEKVFTRQDFERLLALQKAYVSIQTKLVADVAPEMDKRSATKFGQDSLKLQDELEKLLLKGVIWDANLRESELAQLSQALTDLKVDPECAEVVSQQTPAKQEVAHSVQSRPVSAVREKDAALTASLVEARQGFGLEVIKLQGLHSQFERGAVASSQYSKLVFKHLTEIEGHFRRGREAQTSFKAHKDHVQAAQRAFEDFDKQLIASRKLLDDEMKGLRAIFAKDRFTGEGLSRAQLWHLSNMLLSMDPESEIADRLQMMKPPEPLAEPERELELDAWQRVASQDRSANLKALKKLSNEGAASKPQSEPPTPVQAPLSPRDKMKLRLGSPLEPFDPVHEARRDQRASDRIAKQLNLLASPVPSKDELMQAARLLHSTTGTSFEKFEPLAQQLIAGLNPEQRDQLAANLLKMGDLPQEPMVFVGVIAKAVSGELISRSLLSDQAHKPWLPFNRAIEFLLAAKPPMGIPEFGVVVTKQLRKWKPEQRALLGVRLANRLVSPPALPYHAAVAMACANVDDENSRGGANQLLSPTRTPQTPQAARTAPQSSSSSSSSSNSVGPARGNLGQLRQPVSPVPFNIDESDIPPPPEELRPNPTTASSLTVKLEDDNEGPPLPPAPNGVKE